MAGRAGRKEGGCALAAAAIKARPQRATAEKRGSELFSGLLCEGPRAGGGDSGAGGTRSRPNPESAKSAGAAAACAPRGWGRAAPPGPRCPRPSPRVGSRGWAVGRRGSPRPPSQRLRGLEAAPPGRPESRRSGLVGDSEAHRARAAGKLLGQAEPVPPCTLPRRGLPCELQVAHGDDTFPRTPCGGGERVLRSCY